MSSSFATVRTALGLAALLGGLGVNGSAWTQQNGLPRCTTSEYARRDNCFGSVIWSNGERYVGEFRNDKKHGQGTYTWPDGANYVGEFRDDNRSGHGKMNWADGRLYVGEFENGQRTGQGTETWPDGTKYAGEFKDGKQHGRGTYTYPDGRKFVGEFENGKRNGRGSYTASNGDTFVGEYRNGLPNGQGTFTSANGGKYVGEYKDGKRHGQGTNIFPDGGKFEGKFENGTRNGLGTYIASNGEMFVGEFRNGKRNGQGVFTWPSGQKYVGEYRDDDYNGEGTFTYPNRDRYVGQFKNGKYNGQGILYSANETVLKMGIWVNGEFARATIISSPAEPPRPPAANTPPPPAASKTSSGSAFRIANGQFVTNYHVIKECSSLSIDGNFGGRVSASDNVKDLAIISLPSDQGEIANIRMTRPQLNEAVTVVGFPLDGLFSGISVTNGTISRLSGLRGDTGMLQISAPVQPGNSGGPLLDAAGNVIGVVSSRLDALKMVSTGNGIPQNVNFAINGSSLRAFFDAKNISYKEVGNERELTGVQIAARASAFTYLVECQR